MIESNSHEACSPCSPPSTDSRRSWRRARAGHFSRLAFVSALALTASLIWFFVSRTSAQASDAAARDSKSDSGFSYKNDRISRVPWSVHVAKVDRSRKNFAFVATLATGEVLGVSSLSAQAKAVSPEIGRAVAGVNGDFYERDNRTYAGDPRGLQIVNGELVSSPSTVCVWFDTNGNPHLDEVKGDFKVTWPDGKKTPFGLNQQRRGNAAVLYTPTYGPSTRASGGRDLILEKDGDGPWLPLRASQTYRAVVREVRDATDTPLKPGQMVLSLGPQIASNAPEVATGAVLQISTATTPDLKGVQTAIGGGPALIQSGKAFSLKQPPAGASEAYSERSKYERHPRAAVGWNTTHIFLLEVDGRQPGLSMGMTLAELAEYMVKLGCTDGMNFDGGNSATMWVLGQVVNSPCQGEKPVANSLIVVRKEKD